MPRSPDGHLNAGQSSFNASHGALGNEMRVRTPPDRAALRHGHVRGFNASDDKRADLTVLKQVEKGAELLNKGKGQRESSHGAKKKKRKKKNQGERCKTTQ